MKTGPSESCPKQREIELAAHKYGAMMAPSKPATTQELGDAR